MLLIYVILFWETRLIAQNVFLDIRCFRLVTGILSILSFVDNQEESKTFHMLHM